MTPYSNLQHAFGGCKRNVLLRGGSAVPFHRVLRRFLLQFSIALSQQETRVRLSFLRVLGSEGRRFILTDRGQRLRPHLRVLQARQMSSKKSVISDTSSVTKVTMDYSHFGNGPTHEDQVSPRRHGDHGESL